MPYIRMIYSNNMYIVYMLHIIFIGYIIIQYMTFTAYIDLLKIVYTNTL